MYLVLLFYFFRLIRCVVSILLKKKFIKKNIAALVPIKWYIMHIVFFFIRKYIAAPNALTHELTLQPTRMDHWVRKRICQLNTCQALLLRSTDSGGSQTLGIQLTMEELQPKWWMWTWLYLVVASLTKPI